MKPPDKETRPLATADASKKTDTSKISRHQPTVNAILPEINHNNVNFPSCPPPGEGVHSWTLAAANCCRNAGLSQNQAERLIADHVTRPPKPANEIIVAISKAYSASPTRLRSGHRYTATKPTVPLEKIQFDPAKLKSIASRISSPASYRHWLWERSPKLPETQNAFSFLAHLYAPGEQVHIFDELDSKQPIQTLQIGSPTDCRVPEVIMLGGQPGNGIWFLCNPVDGRWHPNPRQGNNPSCRSEESITTFRYAVLESDQAAENDWLSFIVQLPLRIAAIYTSGSRSIHCLIRLDARRKAEWDDQISPLKRPLKLLGADAGSLSAVRLTRLPGCWRPNKGGFQKLLYLCPNPSLEPLAEQPVVFTRAETLKRWRQICPLGRRDQEAFQ